MVKSILDGGSSSGRTADSGSVCRGSNPRPPVRRGGFHNRLFCLNLVWLDKFIGSLNRVRFLHPEGKEFVY